MKKTETIFHLIEVFKNIEQLVNNDKVSDEQKLDKMKSLFKDPDFTLLCRNNQSYESTIDYSRGGASSISMGNGGSVIIGSTKLTWPNPSFEELWKEQNPGIEEPK